jgi:hypothetical protein
MNSEDKLCPKLLCENRCLIKNALSLNVVYYEMDK